MTEAREKVRNKTDTTETNYKTSPATHKPIYTYFFLSVRVCVCLYTSGWMVKLLKGKAKEILYLIIHH